MSDQNKATAAVDSYKPGSIIGLRHNAIRQESRINDLDARLARIEAMAAGPEPKTPAVTQPGTGTELDAPKFEAQAPELVT